MPYICSRTPLAACDDGEPFPETPMRLALYFDKPFTRDRLREAMEAVATELRGEPVTLVEVHRRTLEDKNYPEQAFEARWEAPGVVYTAEARCGIGNPRDGWGYDMRFALDVVHPDGTIRLTLDDGVAGPPHPKEGPFRLEGADSKHFDRVHQVLARYLEHDRTMADYPAVLNIEAALEAGDPAFARTLFERARQRGPVDAYWWKHLQEIEAKL